MKILYIVSTLKSTGPINQLYGIIHNLDRKNFTPYILTLSCEPIDSNKSVFEDDNVKIETLGLNRIAFIFRGKSKLKKVLKKVSPDLIHTSGIRADIALNGFGGGIPVCSTIRNYVFDDYIPFYGKMWGTFMSIWHENAIRKMKNPICCSKTLKDKYEKHLKREFSVIQNGVDTQRYDVKNKNERLLIRQDLELPLNKKIIIVAGHLIDRKDPLTIIGAVEQIQNKSDLQVIFIGDGVLMEKLQKYESDHIKFLGHKYNVYEYYQAADFFISASKSEGLPNTVLEAGACGLPMLLSDIPSHREIFEDNIMGVKFFNVENVAMLKECIVSFLRDYQKYSRAAISDYIKGRYDSQIMSQKYQNFYKKCIDGATYKLKTTQE